MNRTFVCLLTATLICSALRAADLPQGYQLVRKTSAGMLMTVEKPKARSLAAAAESTLNDLDDFFDDDYTVSDGFEDQRTHASLLTGLKAQYQKQPVRGLVVARKSGSGATVFVAFCNLNAPPSAWAELTSKPAPPAANDANPAAPSAPIEPMKLEDYRFPDNTGVIGLAEGYRTQAQSCGATFQVMGPAGQELTFGATFGVSTPNATAVQLARQYPTAYNATMLIAPFADPASTFATLIPQLSRIQQSQGSYAVSIDHLKKVRDLPPVLANSRAALLEYGATRSDRRGVHYQALAEVSITPTSGESFMLYATTLAAPDTTFQQDVPAMLSIAGSLRENGGQIMRNSQAWVDQRNAWFAGQQVAHNTQVEGGESYIHGAQANSEATGKSITDFDEVIRGHRTVEDTRSGERTEVNLGDVDQVVNDLNQQDPGRYVQIKLRDQ